MKHPTITIIINDKTYSLCASDVEAIRNISDTDRQQLITLLEAVKQQENQTQASNQNVAASSQTAATTSEFSNTIDYRNINAEQLGNGDVDALMARLIMEEKSKQKPGLTKQSIYKWVAGIAGIIILLILIL